MENTTANIGYLLLSLGLGVLSLQFFKSAWNTKRNSRPALIGFLLFGAYFALALHTGIFGAASLALGGHPLLTKIALAGVYLLLALAATISINLVFYVLSPRISPKQNTALVLVLGILIVFLTVTPNPAALLSGTVFLLYSLALVPLFFTFHHFYLLARDFEVKQKSLGLMILTATLLGVVFLNVSSTSFLSMNIAPTASALATGLVGILFLGTVATPQLWSMFTFMCKIPQLKIKSRAQESSLSILEFLNAF